MRKYLGLFLLLSVFAQQSARGAVITDLGTLGSDTHSSATDINDSGVIVGASFTLDQFNVPAYHAVRWPAPGAPQAIPTLGGPQSAVYAVNSSGVSVGWSNTAISSSGFYHTPPSSSLPIPAPGTAYGINANGLMVGENIGFGNVHAYAYSGSGSPVDLGSLGGAFSSALDVNDFGVVVGWSTINATTTRRAFKYTSAGGMVPLSGLAGFANSEASAINNAGDIVGTGSSAPRTSGQAFRYASSGTVTFLTSPGGVSYANDINDAGFIVGSVGGHATLWRPDNTVVNLEQWLDTVAPLEGAPWVLTAANAINIHGQIVGYGNIGGVQRAYALDASSLVPEPASAVAFWAALPLFRRRRR